MKRVLALFLMVAMVATCGVSVAADEIQSMCSHSSVRHYETAVSKDTEGCKTTTTTRVHYICNLCEAHLWTTSEDIVYNHNVQVVAETCDSYMHKTFEQCIECGAEYKETANWCSDAESCIVYLNGGGWR